MVKESTQKNMRALRMIMEYKTLLLGYDISILKFPLKIFKFKTCIFLLNFFLIKQKHLNSFILFVIYIIYLKLFH